MNERIQELKDKAWATCEEPEQYMDKFAELIIRECAELTLDHKNDDYYAGWLDYRDEIKKHFGVRE
jgi:hypothetical protein